jgi:hypothetical protein
MLRRTLLVGLFSLGLAAIAQAAPMFVYVVADPTTTAGAAVPATNGMTVSSSKLGAGTFQVYAVDDITGSFGIKSYNIKLNGTIQTLLNRSPNANWNDADDVASPEGFNDVRTATAATGLTSAGQGPTNPFFIKGYGISSNNFPAANPGAVSTTQGSSGEWGIYSAANALMLNGAGLTTGLTNPAVGGSGQLRNAVLLAEGNYTGAVPTIDLVTLGASATAVNYFTSATSAAGASATLISGVNPFGVPEPATVTLLGLAFVGGLGLVRRRS